MRADVAAYVQRSAVIQAWGRFFSSSGRSSILRLALTLAAALALLRAVWPLFELDSFVAYCGGGALIGGILAKVVAELGRRLHDAGWGGWAGWTVTGALFWTLLDGMSHLGWEPSRPQQALPLALVAILLLRPGIRRADRWGAPPGWLRPTIGPVQRRAAPLAAVSVLGMAMLVGAILLISHGMRDNHQRILDMLDRERAAGLDR